MNTPRLPIAGLVTAGAIFISAAPSLAASVTPTVVPGNPTCAELGAATGNPDWQELKIDPPKGGTYTSGDGAFKVTVTTDGQSFDFSVADGELVDAAFAKGGSEGGNLYDYSPAGINADTDLIAPPTGGGDMNNAALSHITFCYTPDKTPPAPEEPPTTMEDPPVVEEPPVTKEEPPAATVTPEQPATPATPAAPAQIAVLGEVVSNKTVAKKAKKKAKKAKKKARRKVKAVKVQAVRAPKFTG